MKSFFIFLALVILGATGYLLYLDYHRPMTPIENQKINTIGLVEGEQNDVRRQSSGSPNWESIDVHAPLFSGDQLRTQKLSTVRIRTNAGLIVDIKENALVGLLETPAGTDLDLKTGEIHSENLTGSDILSTRGAVLSGELAELHLSTDLNGKTHIEVEKGRVTVTDKTQKKLELNIKSTADLLDGLLLISANPLPLNTPVRVPTPTNTPARQTPLPTKVKPSTTLELSLIPHANHLELLKPENEAILNFEPETDSVEFAWDTDIKAKFFVLQVSTTNDFKKIIQSHTINLKRDAIKDLKTQIYFWRVRAYDQKNKLMITSKTYAFNLNVKMPSLPDLIAPAAEISWSSPTPVEFTWKKMENAAKYKIGIFSDLSQRIAIKSFVTDSQIYVWNWQNPKSYYWSVKGLNAKGNIIAQSEVRHLTITAATKEKSPTYVIINPKDQTEVARDLTVEKPEPINFQWRVTKDLPGPLSLIISADPEFKDPITIKNVTQPLVPVTLKKEGIYYWNLSSQSEDGRELELSPVITFNLKSTGGLKAPFRISPTNESTIETDDPKPMVFKWRPSRNAIQYHFVLKKADSKTSQYFIVLDKTVKETTITTDPLEGGNYSWNVYSVDDTEKEVGSEKEFSFRLTQAYQMDSPKLKEPVIK